MTNPVNPAQQITDENKERVSNFDFLPGGMQPVSTSASIGRTTASSGVVGGPGGSTGGSGGVIANPPIVTPPIDPGTWSLPSGFIVDFSPSDITQPGKFGTVVTDALGNQTISVDIICPPVPQAVRFEIRYV